MSTLIVEIGIGPPASGKTTAFRARQSPGMVVHRISPDDELYDEDGKYRFTRERSAQAWAKSYQRLGSILRSPQYDRLVQWDSTMGTVISRSAILNISLGDDEERDVEVIALVLDTPIEVCFARNQARSEDRRVPDDFISGYFARHEPPTFKEGFTQIIRVRGY
jgi:predicted kinase